MSNAKFNSFKEFYPFYLSEHSKKSTKMFHAIGSILVIALLLSSVFLNYAQGPYAICENPYGSKQTPFEPFNDYGFDGVIGTNDFFNSPNLRVPSPK